MTRILAIDTSTRWGTAALVESGEHSVRLVAEAGLDVQDSMAARIIPLIDGLLALAGWPKESIDTFAAARGPGSFTGIRVGLGVLRGLAIASGRRCLGIGTLDAVAEAFGPAEADRVPVLGAGRGEVYAARFDPASSPPVLLVPPWVGVLGHLFETGDMRPAVVLVSAGDEATVRAGAPNGPRRIARAPAMVAAAVGRLAAARVAAGLTDEDEPTPLYVRPSGAEVNSR